jgi:hypothetical protein
LHDDADNPNAFMLFADGFACSTQACHKQKQFGCNLEGLIRQMVFRVTEEVMAWRDAWDCARNNIEKMRDLVKEANVRQARGGSAAGRPDWSQEDLAACLETRSAYYLDRGFRPETLEHFGVGTCVRKLPDGRRLLGWAVVPVLANFGPPYGYTARNPRHGDGEQKVKWLHRLAKSECLYNGNNAWRGRGPLIICEGPGDVFRFFEAGLTTAVATLGGALSGTQYGCFLSLYYHQNVYIAADADEAGKKFAEETWRLIRGVCLRELKILFPPPGRKDFGEATAEEIRALGLTEGEAPRYTPRTT